MTRLDGWRTAFAIGCIVLTGAAAQGASDHSIALLHRSIDETGSDDAEMYLRRTADGPWRLRWAVGGSVSDEGALWAGAGAVLPLAGMEGGGFFAAASFMPGLYARGGGPDLGHAVEFRSGFEAGYAHRSGLRISVVVDHLSNGGLGDVNPGSDAIGLRIAVPLR